MKWGSDAKNGDTRILKKYTWFPIRIKNRWSKPEIEWRWLEQVKIKQEYNTNNFHDDVNFIKDIRVYLVVTGKMNILWSLTWMKKEIRN